MKSSIYPKITQFNIGNVFKVLKVTGTFGMIMPEHVSTTEAAIIVQKGTAILTMNEIDYELQRNTSFIVPAGEKHELKIVEIFQAVVMMEKNSKIQFTNKKK